MRQMKRHRCLVATVLLTSPASGTRLPRFPARSPVCSDRLAERELHHSVLRLPLRRWGEARCVGTVDVIVLTISNRLWTGCGVQSMEPGGTPPARMLKVPQGTERLRQVPHMACE